MHQASSLSACFLLLGWNVNGGRMRRGSAIACDCQADWQPSKTPNGPVGFAKSLQCFNSTGQFDVLPGDLPQLDWCLHLLIQYLSAYWLVKIKPVPFSRRARLKLYKVKKCIYS